MKNELIRVSALAYGGDGVGRGADGKVTLIPGALPGELAEAETIQEKKRFRRCRLVRVLEASPDRIEPECPYFAAGCPGCAYLHCAYSAELQAKQRQLHDFLVRPGLLPESELLPPFGAPQRFGLRNKLVMHVRDGVRGYIGADNRTLIPVARCPLARPEINALLAATPPAGDRETFRYTASDGALRVTAKTPILTETLPGYGDFKVAADGFFQTDIPVAAELVRRAVVRIAEAAPPRLVELHCGVGVFGIAALENLPNLTAFGVEISASAVTNARINAAAHGVADRVEFVAGDAGRLLRRAGACRDAVLLVDPPRTGLDAPTAAAILRAAPRRIIYVSCAPDTLARDVARLGGGYRMTRAGLLDMFPGTVHFEVMAELCRSAD